MTQINNVRSFMNGCDQDTQTFSPRQAALYTGLQLEELAEKLHVLGITMEANIIDGLGNLFKKGSLDHRFENLTRVQKADLLDADFDLTWVSIGAGLSLGADFDKAWALGTANNMAKIDPVTGKARRHPETNKILKPEGHKPPDFDSCF